jgi:hypothetical protein
VQAGALDRDGTKDRQGLSGMIAYTAPQVTAVCTRTLRIEILRHLLLHHDCLQGLEDDLPQASVRPKVVRLSSSRSTPAISRVSVWPSSVVITT